MQRPAPGVSARPGCEKSIDRVSMLVLSPLTFQSNVFVDQAFDNVNPITRPVAAVRSVMERSAAVPIGWLPEP